MGVYLNIMLTVGEEEPDFSVRGVETVTAMETIPCLISSVNGPQTKKQKHSYITGVNSVQVILFSKAMLPLPICGTIKTCVVYIAL